MTTDEDAEREVGREEVGRGLTEICVAVLGCDPADVRPTARLKEDLRVDSLAIVEIAEGLEQRFGVEVPDDRVDALVTVQDAVDAVLRPGPPSAAVPVEEISTRPANAAPAAATASAAPVASALLSTEETGRDRMSPEQASRARRKAVQLAVAFVVVGAAVGGVLGLGGAAAVKASGIADIDIPPVRASSQPTATATATTRATPRTEPTEEPKPAAQPRLSASSRQISPGERVTLSGRIPGLKEGATLQVQIRDSADEPWDDFPVTAQARSGGSFRTQIYTTRPGDRQIRVYYKGNDTATPSVAISIG